MKKAIVALKTYDTVQLFHILDTGRIFKFWGKESIMFHVNYVNSRFKTCSSAFPDSIAERRIYNTPVMDYVVPFGRDSLGRAISTSFDLVFRFADYMGDNKIIDMNVEKYLLKVEGSKIPPPIHPPGTH